MRIGSEFESEVSTYRKRGSRVDYYWRDDYILSVGWLLQL